MIAAECQYGNPVVWAVVDDNQKQSESQSFLLMQSGIPINYPPEQFYRMRHLVTYQDNAFGKSFSLFLETPSATVGMADNRVPKQSNAGPRDPIADHSIE